jgi:O-acetyl-ADP-ribose deacetylase (regulator of RNase III)
MATVINYLVGDATNPKIPGNKVIVHVCNDIGGWGKGFVLAISKRWTTPENKYREWFKTKDNFLLGQTQFVKVESDLWVANLIGQHKINKDENGNAPIRYNAIAKGLDQVTQFAKDNQATVHMPRIGCGLAGGTWDKIEPLIQNSLLYAGIETYVYDFI